MQNIMRIFAARFKHELTDLGHKGGLDVNRVLFLISTLYIRFMYMVYIYMFIYVYMDICK